MRDVNERKNEPGWQSVNGSGNQSRPWNAARLILTVHEPHAYYDDVSFPSALYKTILSRYLYAYVYVRCTYVAAQYGDSNA